MLAANQSSSDTYPSSEIEQASNLEHADESSKTGHTRIETYLARRLPMYAPLT